MELVIGTKAWSTWSLRAWLPLKRTGAPFTEILIPLREDGVTQPAIQAHSPSGQVPALKDGDLVIWDSLAVCEYLAERFPQAALWPADPAARALGRSAAAEMHAGFAPLRKECPMDLGSWGSYSINDVSAILPVFLGTGKDDHARDAETQKLVEAGGITMDPEKRKVAYSAAIKRATDLALWMPLHTYVTTYGLSKTLSLKPYADELPRFWLSKWN